MVLFLALVELFVFLVYMKWLNPSDKQGQYQFTMVLVRLYIMASIILVVGALKQKYEPETKIQELRQWLKNKF